MKIIAICYLIVNDKFVWYTNFVQGGGAECKELNANHTNIKAVNKFQYTGKDGSVKWPYIAVCRKAVITKIKSHSES